MFCTGQTVLALTHTSPHDMCRDAGGPAHCPLQCGGVLTACVCVFVASRIDNVCLSHVLGRCTATLMSRHFFQESVGPMGQTSNDFGLQLVSGGRIKYYSKCDLTTALFGPRRSARVSYLPFSSARALSRWSACALLGWRFDIPNRRSLSSACRSLTPCPRRCKSIGFT